MDKELKAILKFIVDPQATAKTKEGIENITKSLEKMQAEAKATQERMAKWQETADKITAISASIAAVGAAVIGPAGLAINSYIQSAGRAEDVSRRWLRATDDMQQSQLRVGRALAQVALPYMEKVAAQAEKLSQFVEANPGTVELALKGAAVLVGIGAVGAAVGTGIKLVADVKFLAASAQQMAAAVLMDKAAKEQAIAAGKMQPGAWSQILKKLDGFFSGRGVAGTASNLIFSNPIFGPMLAQQTELQRRLAEAAGKAAPVAPTAFGIPLTAAGGVSATSVAAAISPFSILGGVGLGAAGFEGLAQTDFGKSVGMQAGTTGKLASVVAYYAGMPFGKSGDWFKAVSEFTGVAEKATEATNQMADATGSLRDQVGEDVWKQAVDAYDSFQKSNTESQQQYEKQRLSIQQQYGKARAESERNYEKSRADIIASYEKDAARAVADFNHSEAQYRKDYQNSNIKAAADFARSQAQAEAAYYADRVKRAEAYGIEVQRAEEDHERNMARMREDYLMQVGDAEVARDASALVRAKRQYDVNARRAEEDYQTSAGRRNADYAREIADLDASFQQQQTQRAEEYQRQQDEQKAQFEAQRQQRLEEFRLQQAEALENKNARLAELATQHQAELDQMRTNNAETLSELQTQYNDERAARQQAFIDQLTDLDATLTGEQAVRAAHYAAMSADLQAFLSGMESAAVSAAIPTYSEPAGVGNSGTGRVAARAAGGYADRGIYMMGEAGREFVLNSQTTRQLESATGGALTQAGVARGAGGVNVTINAVLNGVARADQGWINDRLSQMEDRVIGEVARIIGGE
jgi:hypothetical protein